MAPEVQAQAAEPEKLAAVQGRQIVQGRQMV